MYITRNIKTIDDTAIPPHRDNPDRKFSGIARRLRATNVALAVSLLMTAGCATDERATPRTAPAVQSERGAPERHVPHKPAAPAADSGIENTGRNVRDRDNANLTPEDQKENTSDRNLTAAIRRSVIKHKSLSLNAHNIKIITRNGVVTLRGPVESSAERIKLQSIAESIRGVKQVDNQLETKTP